MFNIYCWFTFKQKVICGGWFLFPFLKFLNRCQAVSPNRWWQMLHRKNINKKTFTWKRGTFPALYAFTFSVWQRRCNGYYFWLKLNPNQRSNHHKRDVLENATLVNLCHTQEQRNGCLFVVVVLPGTNVIHGRVSVQFTKSQYLSMRTCNTWQKLKASSSIL